MTKKHQGIITRYYKSTDYSLYNCYKTFSSAKAHSYENILDEMFKLNGYDLRILSYNSNFYTCAYRRKDESGKEYLIYHTAYNRISILIDG